MRQGQTHRPAKTSIPPLGEMLNRSYDAQAKDYDTKRFNGPGGRFNARTDARIVRELVARAGAPVVYDIPTGTARVAQYLQGTDRRVIGCDLSLDMLKKARTKADRLGLELDLINANASALPFQSQTIDCIVSLRFLHLFQQKNRFPFTNEFQRVLRPGGHLICSLTNALYGMGINLFRKARGQFNLSLLWPGQVSALFAPWTVIAVRGSFLPLQRWVAHAGANWEQALHCCVSRWPSKSFCFEKFYLLRKTG